jgi:DNA-binding NarL/FixJ family response regulator
MVFFELSGIVIEADSERRSRCSQAARANNSFRKISTIAHPREFESRISEGHVFDVVFIGCSVRPEIVGEVVRAAKRHSEDCACILVASGHEQDAVSLASTMLGGVDGFLCEPFSVDGLAQVAQVAQELKRVNQAQRIKASIRLIVAEMLDSIDDMSAGKAAGRPTPNSSGTLSKLSETVQQLGPDVLPFYHEEIIDRSMERMVPIAPTVTKAPLSKRKDRNAARWGDKVKT